MRDYSEIIKENKRRNGILDAPYDPIKGTGGPLERFEIIFKEIDASFFIPVDMKEAPITSFILKYSSLKEASNALLTTPEALFEAFVRERYKYDFEFWAFSCIKITDKDTFVDVPFKLRGAQRKLLKNLEAMRMAGVPIRIVLLKARQWGGSTLVQIYMMWIQQMHRKNWHLAVCAQDDNAARNISAMYDMAARLYPESIGTITFKPFKHSSKNIKCVERGGIIGVGSVNNPDQFRGYNRAMGHLSEVGIWQDTPKRTAMKLISSLKESIPDEPYTLIVEESTANGLNYFHKSYTKAQKGKTRYRAVFVAWYEIDRCRTPLEIPEEEFIKTMSEYDWFCWDVGATLEGINWYNKHKDDKGYDDWEMQQENPTTEEEAFQSSGQRVYPPSYVRAVRKDCIPPVLIGDVFGKTRAGELALNDIRIEKVTRGKLKIWKTPEEVKKDKIKNRIGAFVDIGGISKNADYSTIKLVDRAPMIYGEDPEVIAVWHGHLDQDLFAWKCAQLCMAYAQPEIGEYPLLAFEINSLTTKEKEGDHSLTILDTIKDYYPNLFIRNDEEKVGDEFVPKYGFATVKKNKGLIITAHKGAMREKLLALTDEQEGWGYVERDEQACDEFDWYEVKDNGTMGAIDGKKDDRVMTTAGAVWLAISYMDAPFVVVEKPKTVTRKIRGYTSF